MVRHELYSAARKWYDIGLELDVKCSTLDNIRDMYKDNNEDSLREMIKMFLQRSTPIPTWRAIVDALNAKAVGYSQLAEEIEKKYYGQHDFQENPSPSKDSIQYVIFT